MSAPQGTPKLRLLQRRAIIPHQALLDGELKDTADDGTPLPDLNNVQGDVYFMFPKRWQQLMFFKITNVAQFRKDLNTYAPRITSSAQTVKDLDTIDKKGGAGLDIVSSGIAFTKAGLTAMGIKDQLKEPHFDQGSLFNEKSKLGDMREYDSVFNGDGVNHGVILLTAGERNTCIVKMKEIRDIFKGSVTVLTVYEGRVRPGDGEHFGWRDGISQPALKDIGGSKPGQRIVNPGVVIMGYPGDPVYDGQGVRPGFTRDGSFMVFRKLEQNVLFLEDYVNKNFRSIPADEPGDGTHLDDDDRKKLFAARIVGRFVTQHSFPIKHLFRMCSGAVTT